MFIKEEEKVCIICHQNGNKNKLNYPCHFRYSNLMSKFIEEPMFPIITITTCSHFIH
jgi:hypothetical protein